MDYKSKDKVKQDGAKANTGQVNDNGRIMHQSEMISKASDYSIKLKLGEGEIKYHIEDPKVSGSLLEELLLKSIKQHTPSDVPPTITHAREMKEQQAFYASDELRPIKVKVSEESIRIDNSYSIADEIRKVTEQYAIEIFTKHILPMLIEGSDSENKQD